MNGKLIRVKIPQMMEQEPVIESKSSSELIELLKLKLLEEVDEVIEAIDTKHPNDVSEEIGDVEEVLSAIKQIFNIKEQEHKSRSSLKTALRGGFLDENMEGVYWEVNKFKGNE